MAEAAKAAKARSSSRRYASIYARAAAMEARFDGMAGDTRPVIEAITHAVLARRPRARYVAPRRFTALIAVVRLLPTCWVDAAMQRMFGLTRTQLAAGTPMP